MSDYSSAVYSTYLEATPRLPIPGQYSSIGISVRRMPTYTVPTGDIAANKTIRAVRMRKGEIPLRAFLNMESGAPASGCIMQLGDGSTAAAYGEGSANALNVEFFDTRARGKGQALAADVDLTLTTKTGTAGLNATKKLDFWVEYLQPVGDK